VITLLTAFFFLLPQGDPIPAPRGLVNDFADVIPAEAEARIERIAAWVRARSGGEIAIVTLRDIGGRESNDVALRIGREWGLGARGAVGDRARNAGVVVLLIPKETATDGSGQIAVEVGQGAEGFIPDGVAGDIWREAIPDLRRSDYGAALEHITYRVAERFAAEFDFSMDSLASVAPSSAVRRSRPGRVPPGAIAGTMIAMFVALLAVSLVVARVARRGQRGRRGRRGRGGLDSALPWILLNVLQQSGRSRGKGGGGGGAAGPRGGNGGGGGGWGGRRIRRLERWWIRRVRRRRRFFGWRLSRTVVTTWL
jgi:uncharacterized protein